MMNSLNNAAANVKDEPPTASRRRKGILKRIVLYPLALYATYCIVLYFVQDSLIFPRDMAPPPLRFPPIAETLEWDRQRPDGTTGAAWFIPAPDASPESPEPAVIFFHGNAEIIDHQVDLINGYRSMGVSVLLPEYPGYGRSEGAPGERAIVDDAAYFLGELSKRTDVDPSRIYLHGRSIGGGPAAQLAARREPAALILESTFTSMASFADGYFAPRFLVRHPFRTDRVVETLRAPLLILHGSRDTIVPVRHAHRLRDLARQSTHVSFVEYDCGHVDFPARENEADYWRSIETFLRKTAGLGANAKSPARKSESPS